MYASFAVGNPHKYITSHIRCYSRLSYAFFGPANASRPPLGETLTGGNRGKRPRDLNNKGGRPKRPRIHSYSSSPSSSQASLHSSSDPVAPDEPDFSPPASQTNASDFIPPSAQIPPSSQASNDAPHASEHASEPPDDRWERILLDFEDAFDRFTESPPLASQRSNPYLRPHLDDYIARRIYTEEPERDYLGAMDRICGKCGAASFKDETPEWCCDKGRTEVGAPETHIHEEDDDDFGDNEGAETRANEPVNANEQALNDILYSTNPTTGRLTEDCKEYRDHSVQYNNAASMASQQVTIDHTMNPFTCRVQGTISTHMPALAPPEGQKHVFGQIYTMDGSTQLQAITRYDSSSRIFTSLTIPGMAIMRPLRSPCTAR